MLGLFNDKVRGKSRLLSIYEVPGVQGYQKRPGRTRKRIDLISTVQKVLYCYKWAERNCNITTE